MNCSRGTLEDLCTWVPFLPSVLFQPRESQISFNQLAQSFERVMMWRYSVFRVRTKQCGGTQSLEYL